MDISLGLIFIIFSCSVMVQMDSVTASPLYYLKSRIHLTVTVSPAPYCN